MPAFDRPQIIQSIVFAAVVIALGVRLTQGLDLGDESYYAQFVAEWLKSGIAASSFRTLHQTAALIVYPATWLYSTVTGSTDGLFLVLRFLFLAESLIAAVLWHAFMRTLDDRWLAAASAILVVAFIPFGLPAPSYNTIGMQATVAAIACIGLAMHYTPGSRPRLVAELGSAMAWGVAVVAYPPLGLVAAMLALGIVIAGESLGIVGRRYAALLVLAGCIAAGTMILCLSPTTVIESIRYLNLVNQVGSLGVKLAHTAALLSPYPWFYALALVAICVGILRQALGAVLHPLLVMALLVAMFAGAPALYIRSHDAITIAALSGLGVLLDLRPAAGPRRRIIAFCYLLAMLVAATTTASALHTFYNFCIGGLPAASLALAAPYARPGRLWPRQAAVTILLLIVLSTSLTFRYGQTSADDAVAKVLIPTGFFKGLHAPVYSSDLLQIVRRDIEPKTRGSTLAVFSNSHPGIALDLSARLRMLTTFPLPGNVSPDALAYNHAYYVDRGNRPQFVLVFREGGLEPVNPMQPDFETWYVRDTEFATAFGVLTLYRQK